MKTGLTLLMSTAIAIGGCAPDHSQCEKALQQVKNEAAQAAQKSEADLRRIKQKATADLWRLKQKAAEDTSHLKREPTDDMKRLKSELVDLRDRYERDMTELRKLHKEEIQLREQAAQTKCDLEIEKRERARRKEHWKWAERQFALTTSIGQKLTKKAMAKADQEQRLSRDEYMILTRYRYLDGIDAACWEYEDQAARAGH